jgi:hypothetical protein
MSSSYFTPGAPGGAEGQAAEPDDGARARLEAAAVELTEQTPNPAAAAAGVNAQLTERGPALPAESEYDALMDMLRKQAEQIQALSGQVGNLKKAADEKAAETGGPPVLRYAQAVADRLAATAVAHPDLGADHFAHPLAAAEQLIAQARQLHTGEVSDPAGVHNAAARLERWITRTHPRTSAKHVETLSTVADDLEQVRDEADKVAA